MNHRSQALYLVRHSQTTAANGCIIGATEQPLSLHGGNQANRLIDSFLINTPAIIYCSDLLRARQTASILQRSRKIEVEHCDLINEMNFGDWENQTCDEIYNHDP